MPKSRKPKSAQQKLNFSPKSTSDDDEVVINEEKTRASANRKRSSPCTSTDTKPAATAATPKKAKPASATVVTPAQATAQKKKQEDVTTDEYVPKHIHKNVDYHRKGEAADALPAKTLKAFQLISECYIIPNDIEQSRAYGPLSGSSYEERVISAYRLGKLQASDEPATIICTECVSIGHQRDDCPTLL